MLAALIVQTIRIEHLHPFEAALLKPLAAALAAGAVELGVHALPLPGFARVAAVVIAGAVTYAAVLLALRPGDEERRIILKLWRVVVPRRGKDGDPSP